MGAEYKSISMKSFVGSCAHSQIDLSLLNKRRATCLCKQVALLFDASAALLKQKVTYMR
jgi:hypothetical protein